ncbi:MAG TPA: SRPBCC family protein [Acidimicrobiales bacterium]|nr:SRPBCC family protein [Acidimicrobiales bacterium]
MGRYSYQVTARSAAPPKAVFAVLADGAGWSDWAGPLVRYSAWAPGGPEPVGGVGSVRLLGTRAFHSREEIVESRPPEVLAYAVRSGWPVKDYRAEVRLEPDGPGTLITWSGSFDALVPGTGAVVLALTRPMIAGFARRLADAAGTDPGGPAGP